MKLLQAGISIATCLILLAGSGSSAGAQGAGSQPLGVLPPAPEIAILHGELLASPVVITSWYEIHRLLIGAGWAPQFRAGEWLPLTERPVVTLSLFWGYWWRDVAESPQRLAALRPAHADQQAQFYPAFAGRPALLMIGGAIRTPSDSSLAVLRRHGVPVQVP